MLFTKVFHEDKVVQDDRMELTDKGSLYFLGPNLTVTNCTLVLKVPARNLQFDGVRFVNCTFEVKQELKNHQSWVFASLKGCRFKGRLSGCDLGTWHGYSEGSEFGFIEDCDFSEARMNGCRIMGCDPATLHFPKWPCFTLLNPIGRAPELRSRQWPGRFGRIVIEHLHTQPAPTRALTYHAPSIAKELDTTEEELRAVIEKFDCIVY